MTSHESRMGKRNRFARRRYIPRQERRKVPPKGSIIRRAVTKEEGVSNIGIRRTCWGPRNLRNGNNLAVQVNYGVVGRESVIVDDRNRMP